jgi:hypothetical protein
MRTRTALFDIMLLIVCAYYFFHVSISKVSTISRRQPKNSGVAFPGSPEMLMLNVFMSIFVHGLHNNMMNSTK